MAEIDEVLEERGLRYGTFIDQAKIQDYLITAVTKSYDYIGKEPDLEVDQIAAIEMIIVKLARIINGDPNYVDSWTDIAGYATLVANRLQGKIQ